MTIVLNGTTGITNDGGYTGDGVVFADTTPANTLVTTTGGNVGIGTSSPAAKLNVSRTDSTLIGLFSGTTRGARIGTNSTYSFIEGVDNTGSASYQPFMIGGSDVRFTTSDVERAKIDSSGNLLVGTTSATGYRLTVNNNGNGGISVQQTGAGQYSYISNAASLAGTYYHAQFLQASTPVGSITSTGSSTSYNTSSDYRLKENIAPMTGAIDVVQQLKPVTYNWKVDGSRGQGFIAHELQAVVPDCVTGEKDAVDKDGKPIYQGIDVSFLVATLTAAIQEQQAIITDLKARIETLESK